MKVYNMKILLMSDTHGEQEAARRILQEHAAADLKIHLGDVGFPLQEIDECSIVKGNHDRSHRLPKKMKLTLEGRKAICLHGDIFDDETVQEVLAMKHTQMISWICVCVPCMESWRPMQNVRAATRCSSDIRIISALPRSMV